MASICKFVLVIFALLLATGADAFRYKPQDALKAAGFIEFQEVQAAKAKEAKQEAKEDAKAEAQPAKATVEEAKAPEAKAEAQPVLTETKATLQEGSAPASEEKKA
eukprot:TRINITY_DN5135_c5_g1_i1.p1 TRINITY_DN5135_c5_g1~~TRINITY_DN5135_c5_g1_i1.p1  ORF type:complete len:106 (+),score=51.89 TRINITY_DN5135_c5_g1_i1:110-427(+)